MIGDPHYARMLAQDDIDAIEAAFAADRAKTKKGLADALGRQASAVTELLRGERKLGLDEVRPLQTYLKIILPSVRKIVTVDQLPEASMNDKMPVANVKIAPVRGDVAAGVWMEHDAMREDLPYDIPYVPTRYENLEQFAYKVGGPSMELERIFDGDYVVCVDYALARGIAQPGDVVVAERRRGGLLERTCKMVASDRRGGLSLVARSKDPRFKDPVPLANGNEDVEVVIVGLVVGTFRPRW